MLRYNGRERGGVVCDVAVKNLPRLPPQSTRLILLLLCSALARQCLPSPYPQGRIFPGFAPGACRGGFNRVVSNW